MSEWSVLVKCIADETVPPITDALRYMLLNLLPGENKWYQYPPASGRGNGFEVRFWLHASDAADASAKGARAVTHALVQLQLEAWRPVRIHAASHAARVSDAYPALETRPHNRDQSAIHVRVEFQDGHAVDETQAGRFKAALGDDIRMAAEAGALEAKFWVEPADAAEGADVARTRVVEALGAAGIEGGVLTRIHTSNFDETARLHYFGLV